MLYRTNYARITHEKGTKRVRKILIQDAYRTNYARITKGYEIGVRKSTKGYHDIGSNSDEGQTKKHKVDKTEQAKEGKKEKKEKTEKTEKKEKKKRRKRRQRRKKSC